MSQVRILPGLPTTLDSLTISRDHLGLAAHIGLSWVSRVTGDRCFPRSFWRLAHFPAHSSLGGHDCGHTLGKCTIAEVMSEVRILGAHTSRHPIDAPSLSVLDGGNERSERTTVSQRSPQTVDELLAVLAVVRDNGRWRRTRAFPASNRSPFASKTPKAVSRSRSASPIPPP